MLSSKSGEKTNHSMRWFLIEDYASDDYMDIGHYGNDATLWVLKKGEDDLRYKKVPEPEDDPTRFGFTHNDWMPNVGPREVDLAGRIDHDQSMISVSQVGYGPPPVERVRFALDVLRIDYPEYKVKFFGIPYEWLLMEMAVAYHGSPYRWKSEPGFPLGRPLLSKIGTGEGAEAYGWGWYSAESEDVGRHYMRAGESAVLIDGNPLSNRKRFQKLSDENKAEVELLLRDIVDGTVSKNELFGYAAHLKGPYLIAYTFIRDAKSVTYSPEESLYKIDIPNRVIPSLLDWDMPFKDQPDFVQVALRRAMLPSKKEIESWREKLQNDLAENGPAGYSADRLNKVFNVAMEEGAYSEEFGSSVWDELREAAPTVAKDAIVWMKEKGGDLAWDITGEQIYGMLVDVYGSQKAASEFLASVGIPGTRYLDAQSRETGVGTYNYVIWDQGVLDQIEIIDVNEVTESMGPTKWVFSWHCTNPPDIEIFKDDTDEDLSNYSDLVDYIVEHGKEISARTFIKTVGRQNILDSLMYGSGYGRGQGLTLEGDWAISWYRSKYPDGTPIMFFQHSAIEHVFEPEGYELYRDLEERYGGAEKERGIWYHGTTPDNLRSILAQGLIVNPKKKAWAEDPNTSISMASRVSYGGIYITKNMMTAISSAKGNRKVIVCMSLQPRTFLMDEDEFVHALNYSTVPTHISGHGYSIANIAAPYIVPKEYVIDSYYKDQVNRNKDYFDDFEGIVVSKLFKDTGDIPDELSREIHKDLLEAWKASIYRKLAYIPFQEFMAGVEGIVDRNKLKEKGIGYEKWKQLLQGLHPEKEKVEVAFRAAVDKLTRVFKSFARPLKKGDVFNPTGRVMDDIGYHGSNRIICVMLIDINYSPAKITVYYGDIPEEFKEQFSQRWGEFEITERGKLKEDQEDEIEDLISIPDWFCDRYGKYDIRIFGSSLERIGNDVDLVVVSKGGSPKIPKSFYKDIQQLAVEIQMPVDVSFAEYDIGFGHSGDISKYVVSKDGGVINDCTEGFAEKWFFEGAIPLSEWCGMGLTEHRAVKREEDASV